MKNFSEQIPSNSDPEYEGEAPIPKKQDKVYGPDGTWLKEDPSAGYELPSKMRERFAYGWRKIGRTSIPVFRITPDSSRPFSDKWRELPKVPGKEEIVQEPVYDDEGEENFPPDA